LLVIVDETDDLLVIVDETDDLLVVDIGELD